LVLSKSINNEPGNSDLSNVLSPFALRPTGKRFHFRSLQVLVFCCIDTLHYPYFYPLILMVI
jgi:hypothetical protein